MIQKYCQNVEAGYVKRETAVWVILDDVCVALASDYDRTPADHKTLPAHKHAVWGNQAFFTS
jgi:hypothetical protein